MSAAKTLYALLLQLWRDGDIVLEWERNSDGWVLIEETIRQDALERIASWYMRQDIAEFVTEALLESPWSHRVCDDLNEHDHVRLGTRFADALQHEAENWVKRSDEWDRLQDASLLDSQERARDMRRAV